MPAIIVSDCLKRPIAVSREAAHVLEDAIRTEIASNSGNVELDFAGIAGVTPSFLDELLTIIESLSEQREWGVRARNLPTGFLTKFAAVSRAHKAQASLVGNEWVLSGGLPT